MSSLHAARTLPGPWNPTLEPPTMPPYRIAHYYLPNRALLESSSSSLNSLLLLVCAGLMHVMAPQITRAVPHTCRTPPTPPNVTHPVLVPPPHPSPYPPPAPRYM
jgi:hypothetical protein